MKKHFICNKWRSSSYGCMGVSNVFPHYLICMNKLRYERKYLTELLLLMNQGEERKFLY